MLKFDQSELMIHFARHRADVGVATSQQYELLAIAFLSRSDVGGSLMECTRKKGDVLRYDTLTAEFGVLAASGMIRTYFKPIPCSSLPAGVPKTRCHRHADNVAYFQFECGRER